jgi:hypothetical protein
MTERLTALMRETARRVPLGCSRPMKSAARPSSVGEHGLVPPSRWSRP